MSDDPTPIVNSTHGTACGGAAAAAVNNSVCGVGVAYGATLSGITFLAIDIAIQPSSGEVLTVRGSGVDVSSNSWGATGEGRITGFYKDSESFFDAVDQLTSQNRDGKGAVIHFAGGNDGQKIDYCEREEKMASPLIIVVGATSDQGKHVGYSEPCSNVLVTAPSQEQNDVSRRRGIVVPYNVGNSVSCQLDFSGTSAATPIVAGVSALLLEANRNLTYRDVQTILATTATQVDPTEPSWTTNGAGVKHSTKFGFGRVNALAAVQAAKTWTNLPAVQTSTTVNFAGPVAVPDGTGASATVTTSLTLPARARIEHVLVRLDLDHPSPNQVRVEIESPSGFRSILVHEFAATAQFIATPTTYNVPVIATPYYNTSAGVPSVINFGNVSVEEVRGCNWTTIGDPTNPSTTLIVQVEYGYLCPNLLSNINTMAELGYVNVILFAYGGYVDWKSTAKAPIPTFFIPYWPKEINQTAIDSIRGLRAQSIGIGNGRIPAGYRVGSWKYFGESGSGSWKLHITDLLAGTSGTFNGASMQVRYHIPALSAPVAAPQATAPIASPVAAPRVAPVAAPQATAPVASAPAAAPVASAPTAAPTAGSVAPQAVQSPVRTPVVSSASSLVIGLLAAAVPAIASMAFMM